MDDLIKKVMALESSLASLRARVESEERARDEWREEVKSLLSTIDARIRVVEKIVWTGVGILAVLQLFAKKLI